VSVDRLQHLSPYLNEESRVALRAILAHLLDDLTAMPDEEITVEYIAQASGFSAEDIDLKRGKASSQEIKPGHRIKVWLRVYPTNGDFYWWLRLSRVIGQDGKFVFDRIQWTWKGDQEG
jgi:hypothetical protein